MRHIDAVLVSVCNNSEWDTREADETLMTMFQLFQKCKDIEVISILQQSYSVRIGVRDGLYTLMLLLTKICKQQSLSSAGAAFAIMCSFV